MRIGLSSIVGDGFGTGSFVFGEILGEPPSFPPYGTFIETLYLQEVPIASGGGFVTYQSVSYPNQLATVDKLANGTGGWFLDWANLRDAQYKTSQFTTYSSNTSDIIINGYNYGAGCSYYGDVFHDGMGSYTEVGTGGGCYGSGTLITNDGTAGSSTIMTPVGSFTTATWSSIDYFHDGSGGYYSVQINPSYANYGDYIGNDGISGSLSTEVPSLSGNYFIYAYYSSRDYYYDGSSSYYTSENITSQANYGDFITNDGTYDYYWDGNGGYYT